MKTTKPVFAVLAACVLGLWSPARASDLLPSDRPIEEAVDYYLNAGLSAAHVAPAPQIDDAGLLRRLTLDLVGRIPTAAEVRSYLDAPASDKRRKLVDRLMASPGFANHQAEELDSLMMAGTRGTLRDFLAKSLTEFRSWDQIFRAVILADEANPRHKGAVEFLQTRTKDMDRLTSDVSSVFFGVNISCAKCHDHPLVKDWKQDHFYGMKSFFNRTFKNGDFLAEREFGVVRFKTTKGDERDAKLMFLTGKVVPQADKPPTHEEAKKAAQLLDEAKKKKLPPPPPAFSARAQLVEVALGSGEREFFAKAIVNRTWHRLFGRGLVMPLDQMHTENPPSHPELLDWLARDTVEHGYSLRRLIRGLVLSNAYARSGHWDSDKTPEPRQFAVAADRPLTPIQLARSMWVATADPATFSLDVPADERERRLSALEGQAHALANAFARPGEDYQIGVAEALLLSNSERLKPLLADGGGRLVGRLAAAKERDERIDMAVRNVLSRPTDDEELSLLGDYLRQREDRPAEACRQLVWALLTSAEFRFNH